MDGPAVIGESTEERCGRGNLIWFCQGLPAAEKRRCIEGFARYLKGLLGRDSFPLELGPDDFEAAPGGGWSFRPKNPGVPFGAGPISFEQELSALASLYSHMLLSAGRTDRLRFFKAYRGSGGNLRHERDYLRRVEEAALKSARRRWRKEARMSLSGKGPFVRERLGGFSVRRRKSVEAEVALKALLPDPDNVLERGHRLPGRGTSCIASKVTIDGRSYFLKKYYCRGWGYRVKNVFRPSRALKVWGVSWGFLARGIPVPEPVVVLEERRLRLLGSAYVLTEFVEDGQGLMDLWPRLGEALKDRITARAAFWLGRMHRFGCLHGDTNWDNILVRNAKEGRGLLFVDLDCARICRRVRPERARRDLNHYLRDLWREKNDGGDKERFFIDCWRRWFRTVSQ